MTLAEFFVALIMAVSIGLLFYYGFRVTGPWGNLWAFLSILVLAGIAAEAWVNPIGPYVFGVSWLGAFFFILIFALLIGAATPPRRREEEIPPGAEAEDPGKTSPAALALGTFFWFLLIILAIAIIGGLVYTPSVV